MGFPENQKSDVRSQKARLLKSDFYVCYNFDFKDSLLAPRSVYINFFRLPQVIPTRILLKKLNI